jgi:hypothetical protein
LIQLAGPGDFGRHGCGIRTGPERPGSSQRERHASSIGLAFAQDQSWPLAARRRHDRGVIAMPVASQHDSFGIVWRTALAGSAGRDAAASRGRAGDERGSFRGLADGIPGGTGRAFGLERRDGLEQARARYGHALDHRRGRGHTGAIGLERGPWPLAHRLSPQETRRLIEHGWRPGREPGPGFRNHGERVRTMVELSKRLGHGAQVGALQASFGTPQETGIAALAAELAMARGELDANPEDPEAEAWVDQLEMELAVAIDRAEPGLGADRSWASADLDVNGDGLVDPQDLAAFDAGQATMPAGYVGSRAGR